MCQKKYPKLVSNSFFLPYPYPLDTSQFLQHYSVEGTLIIGGEEIWRWELHHLETWSQGGFSKLLQPRGSTSFGCSRCSLTAGGCQDLVVVGRCIGELAYQVHGAGLISWHILPSSLSPKTVHPRDPSLPRLQGYSSVPDH